MYAKKSFGQHFLRDQSVIDKIVSAAIPEKDEVVVEIGPGTGALTSRLVDVVQHELVLIEADHDLLPALHEQFPQATILAADAVEVDYPTIVGQKPWLAVGNLPYNAANAIVMNILTAPKPPRKLVIMVQKEVGDRMMAKPGDMGVLSVATQLYADVKRLCTVKPGAFAPPPKVDSVVLELFPKTSQQDREAIVALAKIGFANRRKQLQRNLIDSGRANATQIKSWFTELGIATAARAQELSLEQWIALAQK